MCRALSREPITVKGLGARRCNSIPRPSQKVKRWPERTTTSLANMIQPKNKRNKTFRRPVDLLRLKNRSSLNKDLLEIFAALHSWEN